MKSKKIHADSRTRLYKSETGAALSCKVVEEAGSYNGWCGLVEDQSDYVLGPYSTHKKHVRCRSITLFDCQAPLFEVLA